MYTSLTRVAKVGGLVLSGTTSVDSQMMPPTNGPGITRSIVVSILLAFPSRFPILYVRHEQIFDVANFAVRVDFVTAKAWRG
jgi:hypothetical protein